MKNFCKWGKSFVPTIFSLAAIFLIWQILSLVINAPLILPKPLDVLRTLVQLSCQKIFWQNIAATASRVLSSFFISVALGILLGVLCGSFEFVKKFLELPFSIIMATPVVAFILVALFWFGADEIPIFVSVVLLLPIIAKSVETGFNAGDKSLYEMAEVYKFNKSQKFKFITLPSIMPFFLNGCVSAFGMAWKVVAAGEVISLPKKGAGTLLQVAQVHLETGQVMAVTIVLVAICFCAEKLFSLLVRKLLKGDDDEN